MAGTNYSDLDIQANTRVSLRWDHSWASQDCWPLPLYGLLAYTEINIKIAGKQRPLSFETRHLLTRKKKGKAVLHVGDLGIEECSSNVQNVSLKPTSDSENG